MPESINPAGISSFLQSDNVLLQQIKQILLSSRDGAFPLSVTSSPGTGVARTLSASNQTDSSNSPVAAGARSVLFVFSSDFAGTVMTMTVDKSQSPSMSFTADGNNTLPTIAYTVSAGSVNIFKMI